MPDRPSTAAASRPAFPIAWIQRVALAPRLTGRRALRVGAEAAHLGLFTLAAIATIIKKFNVAPQITRPLLVMEVHRAAVQLLPVVTLTSAALGLAVVGQALSFFSRFGAVEVVGAILGTAIIRELSPLLAASLVLARVGSAIVVELGAARATGQIEALETIGVDPTHYFVAPRLIGVLVAVVGLNVYLTILTLAATYGVILWQGIAISPDAFLSQITASLNAFDFAFVGVKTTLFGLIIGVITCFEGLARPIRLADVPRSTARAINRAVLVCLIVDALGLIFLLPFIR